MHFASINSMKYVQRSRTSYPLFSELCVFEIFYSVFSHILRIFLVLPQPFIILYWLPLFSLVFQGQILIFVYTLSRWIQFYRLITSTFIPPIRSLNYKLVQLINFISICTYMFSCTLKYMWKIKLETPFSSPHQNYLGQIFFISANGVVNLVTYSTHLKVFLVFL